MRLKHISGQPSLTAVRGLLELMPCAVVLEDADTCEVLAFSPEATALFGFSPDGYYITSNFLVDPAESRNVRYKLDQIKSSCLHETLDLYDVNGKTFTALASISSHLIADRRVVISTIEPFSWIEIDSAEVDGSEISSRDVDTLSAESNQSAVGLADDEQAQLFKNPDVVDVRVENKLRTSLLNRAYVFSESGGDLQMVSELLALFMQATVAAQLDLKYYSLRTMLGDVQTAANQIKFSVRHLGAKALENLAQEIEYLALKGDCQAMQRHIDALLSGVAELRGEVANWYREINEKVH